MRPATHDAAAARSSNLYDILAQVLFDDKRNWICGVLVARMPEVSRRSDFAQHKPAFYYVYRRKTERRNRPADSTLQQAPSIVISLLLLTCRYEGRQLRMMRSKKHTTTLMGGGSRPEPF